MTTERNDGGAAFPLSMETMADCDGMSLRDYFAGKAPVDWGMAQQAAQLSGTVRAIDRPKMWAAMAVLRYEFADAMLAERLKP